MLRIRNAFLTPESGSWIRDGNKSGYEINILDPQRCYGRLPYLGALTVIRTSLSFFFRYSPQGLRRFLSVFCIRNYLFRILPRKCSGTGSYSAKFFKFIFVTKSCLFTVWSSICFCFIENKRRALTSLIFIYQILNLAMFRGKPIL